MDENPWTDNELRSKKRNCVMKYYGKLAPMAEVLPTTPGLTT